MDAQWHLAKQIFLEAIDLPPGQHNDFVHSRCQDEGTAKEILQMLRAHGEEGNFLASPLSSIDDELTRDPLIGHTFENFRITQRIGKGGMGAVYEATQSEPHRNVAIKVLRHDTAIDESALSRFQNESEVLARLQHPNIAHVYASGTIRDDEGHQPWFAMELVNGFTLNQHLRQNQLTERQKLELFLQICDGVSHAHGRDVIHRDLKPANVLIDKSGSTPQAKIVDFGIARVASGAIESDARTQAILGSINYLSPEQVAFEDAKLDHRCDIYALGVLLFEMLTGQLPHDRKSEPLTSVLAKIQHDPGVRLREIDRRFSKDLEVIASKAVNPEAAIRYQSVEELSADIRRYLNGEPILARPPSTAYRLRKYISRNKVLVGGATTTILALAAGLVTYIWIADQARQSAEESKYEARKAVAVNSFVTNDFLTRLLQNVRSSRQGTDVNQLITAASAKIDTMYADDPLLEAAVRNEVGTIYYSVGSFDKAGEEYRRALELWESELGVEHADTLKAVNNLTQSLMGAARSSEPETLALGNRAFEGRNKVLGMENPATIASLNNLAQLYLSHENPAKAEQLFLDGLKKLKGTKAETFSTRLTLTANLGSLYVQQKETEKALELHRQSYVAAKDFFGMNHPLTLKSGVRFVQTLDRLKRYDEAQDELAPILDEYERIGVSEPGSLLIPLRLQARIFRHMDQDENARQVLERALGIASRNPGKFARDIQKIARDLKRLRSQLNNTET